MVLSGRFGIGARLLAPRALCLFQVPPLSDHDSSKDLLTKSGPMGKNEHKRLFREIATLGRVISLHSGLHWDRNVGLKDHLLDA